MPSPPQIITMADSGLDVNSCFFSEEQTEDNIECSTFSNPVYDLTKRKVRGWLLCSSLRSSTSTHKRSD